MSDNLYPIGTDISSGKQKTFNDGDILLSQNTTLETTVSAHGFSSLSAVRHNGTTWVKAQADSDSTLAHGVCVEVINSNQFIFSLSGKYTYSSPHGLSVGNWYFLSDVTAGALVADQPALSQSLVFVLDSTSILIYPHRSAVADDSTYIPTISPGFNLYGLDRVTTGSKQVLEVALDNDGIYYCEYNLNLSGSGLTTCLLLFNGDTSIGSGQYYKNGTVNNADLIASSSGFSSTSQYRGGFFNVKKFTNGASEDFPIAICTEATNYGTKIHIEKYVAGGTPLGSVSLRSTNVPWGVGSYLFVYKVGEI